MSGNKFLYGRKVLQTSESEITSGNLLRVLDKVMDDFESNRDDIEYLYWYYRGKQPIINRTKVVREDIKNDVVENHANEIVSFKKGYTFGYPVQYVRRALKDEKPISPVADNGDEIYILNEIMACEDKYSKDEELAEWFYICGTAYRMTLPKVEDDGTVSRVDIETLDPRNTAVVYNTGFGNKPVMSIQRIKLDDDEDGNERIQYSIYTRHKYFEVIRNQIVYENDHYLGFIPIVEYPANKSRLGAFEVVLPLLDAINTLASNRVDDIEQTVQAFMKFVNVRIDDEKYEEFRKKGVLMFTSEPNCPADVSIVANKLDQTQPETLANHLYQQVLTICGVPDRNSNNRNSGDTGQAVILRDGWSAAETKARETELIFRRSEKEFLRYVIRLSGLKINLGEVDIKFTRNKTDNLLTKTQGLQNMLESGVAPQLAFTTCGLFSDPEQACKDSEEYLKKWVPNSAQPEAEVVRSDNKENPTD